MAARPIDTFMNPTGDERRRGRRMPLRWEARLIRRNGTILPTATENLSSSGFYCHTTERLIPGEEFDCYITLPPNHAPSPNRPVVLLCRGRVARVESLAGDRYGVGCQIDDYLLIPE
jgi:PilZ domain